MDTRKKLRLGRVKNMNELPILIGVLALALLIYIVNPKFISGVNMGSLFENITYLLIPATAMTLVIITGAFDMSVGSVIAFTSCISALLMFNGMAVFPACVLGLLCGAGFGLLNGLLIVKVGIPPFIVTLGTMYIARGAVKAITKGEPVYPLPESFGFLGNGSVVGIPVCVIIALVLCLVTDFVLRHTTYGRSLLAIGGNQETARLSGIKVDGIQISAYVLTSIMAGLGGLVMTSKLGSAQLSLGTGYEMKIIASVVIGGTSLMGGSGTILGTFLGATLMSLISNGMVLMRVSVFWQDIIIGAILIFAVGVDVIKRKRDGVAV